jgi:diguanylate cyclase (GGDEF)-like protein/putative nucleotidyltransferase with HDIG domain
MKHGSRFAVYLIICILASAMKITLPGIFGTLSVSYVFILIGILDMSAGQTILMGCAGALVQCVWKPKSKVRPVRAVFSVMNMAIAVFGAYSLYHSPLAQRLGNETPIALIVTGLAYFVLNTGAVAAAVAFTERKSLRATWRSCYFWSFPFYLFGASIAWVYTMATDGNWQRILLVLPVIYVVYRSYRIYLDDVSDEKKHAEQMAALHLRTIEALALAIEAKDHTTHQHLSCTRTYAVELGKELGLSESELEALRAAALLHNVGKLAVPEHILSKSGKMTREEFEKMKIHPVIGAEILERVEFSYPVVPIVRSHHENWDGTGYPDGLRGEEIPIGARILAAVNCLHGLISGRQDSEPLPLAQAMQELKEQSGKALDPTIVELLIRTCPALETKAVSKLEPLTRLSTDLRVACGEAPATGFEVSTCSAPGRSEYEFLTSIAAARQEVQLLFELTQDLGSSLSLDETLSVAAARLKRMIPYDAIAVYVTREGSLVPEYVNGESFRLLSSLQIPIGQGLSGWVAQTGRAILNGNPEVEFADAARSTEFTTFRSAIAAPLVGLNGTIGALTVYRTDTDAFSSDHLRILLAVTSKLSRVIDNALKFRLVETTATTDYLTELPNARSLFLRLDSEVSRCKRINEPLTVLVCDLDGFKQVNDRHGHVVGNKVLRVVADGLRKICRSHDYVARMGGDEFVLILPGSDRAKMKARMLDLREVAASAGRLVTGSDIMGMSIGEAFFPNDGTDAEQLLAEADRRMYRAKQSAKLRILRPVALPELEESLCVQ